MPIQSINPANGKIVETYAEITSHQAAAAVEDAHQAWLRWRMDPLAIRAVCMKRAAGILTQRRQQLTRLMATEMGKPLKQGLAEIDKCAWVCDYYAQNAETHLAPDVIKTDALDSYVAFEPLGVVLAIMPWNFPFWQVFRFAAPALMAGNAAVLKHASNVPGCALAIEQVLTDAGFPSALFRTLLIPNSQIRSLIEHPLVRAVTLTGSASAGRAVAAQAGAALKKTVLELGGSDPYLVLNDADLDLAAEVCATSRLINAGQSCIAAKRFIVLKPVLAPFTQKLTSLMKARKVGDPLAADTDVGPLARHDLRQQLHQQVRDSLARGARLLLGGEIPPGDGAYYPPTVLADVLPGMPAFDQETFGPVAAIIAADGEEDAVRLANHTVFGLGAAVFTQDIPRGQRIAHRLEAGAAFVNSLVASDPRLPFGGIKDSGFGRELGSYGIREFVNAKTVSLAHPPSGPSPRPR